MFSDDVAFGMEKGYALWGWQRHIMNNSEDEPKALLLSLSTIIDNLHHLTKISRQTDHIYWWIVLEKTQSYEWNWLSTLLTDFEQQILLESRVWTENSLHFLVNLYLQHPIHVCSRFYSLKTHSWHVYRSIWEYWFLAAIWQTLI